VEARQNALDQLTEHLIATVEGTQAGLIESKSVTKPGVGHNEQQLRNTDPSSCLLLDTTEYS